MGDTITDAARPAASLARLPKGDPHGVLRHLSGGRRQAMTTCGRRWKSCSSTTPRSPLSRRPRSRWASASAADFWGCCTWRSSRSGWSGSSTWTSITTAPSVSLPDRAHRRRRACSSTIPPTSPTRASIAHAEEPYRRGRTSITPPEFVGDDHGAVPGEAGRLHRHDST